MKHYPPQPFTLPQCIGMHQEAAQPAMTNTLHMQIYADCTLDFSTKKKVSRKFKSQCIWYVYCLAHTVNHQCFNILHFLFKP